MSRPILPSELAAAGLVVVARRLDDAGYAALERLADAGEPVVFEVTMDDPGAAERIERLRGRNRVVGAGTVLTREEAARAVGSGAQFLVSPVLDEGLVESCAAQGVPFAPGAATPSEILRGWNAGAAIVKVFPASVAGTALLREVRGPLGHIPLMPTGGIGADNAGAFFAAGAVAVGVGGSLTGAGADAIPARWHRLRTVVERHRAG